MNRAIIISFFSIILLSITALFEVNYLDYEAPIPYSDWQKITFHDFKGIKKPFKTLLGAKEFAYIKTSMEINFLPGKRISVTTYFHPSRSYVFNKYIRDNDLLKHELYHFHIAEYCSRLLRKEISEQRGTLSSFVISELLKKYTQEENAMQIQYDDETFHSYVLEKQKDWENDIDSKLKLLENFRNTVVILKE